MKNLFKKPWFLSISIIGTLVLSYLLLFLVVNLRIDNPFNGSFLALSRKFSTGDSVNVISFVLMIAFYVLVIPILISVFSIVRKKNWGILMASVGLFIYSGALMVVLVINAVIMPVPIIILVITFLLESLSILGAIYRKKTLNLDNESVDKLDENGNSIAVKMLIIDALAILVILTTFFVPLYSRVHSGGTYTAILINALFAGDTNLEVVIYFLVSFFAFVGSLLYFANVLSYYFFDKKSFINKSKDIINLVLVLTFIFFAAGVAFNVIYTLQGNKMSSIAFIPVLLMVIVNFLYAVLRGTFYKFAKAPDKKTRIRYAKVEPLFYIVLLTLVTGLVLLMPIISMEVSFGSYESSVKLTGLKILRDYGELDKGYRMVAFILIVMLIASGISIVNTITSYLANSKSFNSMVKMGAVVNTFFVFIIAISGYYFKIAQGINEAAIMEVFDFYGIPLPDGYDYTYKVGTDAIYILFGSIAVLSLMFFRKAFERPYLQAEASLDLALSGGSDGKSAGSGLSDELVSESIFDPAPSITFIDSQVELYKKDLEERKKYTQTGATLSDLVLFVVDYAKNSRLHLSYTPEDIATFVAGLGASKLSILQGMSGTGKTSLPKIFAEAILGNCEIIEVESSWKDKNELLGYYNEFSKIYTPKKFTLSLYKAALNPEVFTFILLDEMNLSRIEYYFSDFLSLMEHEEHKREIKLLNINIKRKDENDTYEYSKLINGNTLIVPPNVWFIGTANRDESTFVISDKVYDRAHTMNFMKRAPKVRNYSNPIPKQFYDYKTINELLINAKESGNFDAENSEIIKGVEVLLAPFNISFGNRILKQIEEFVNVYKACFQNENVEAEAVEKIILSKVVQKLETKTIDDKEKLVEAFEKLRLNQCAEFVRRLDID